MPKGRGFRRKHLIIMALGNIIGSGIFLASGEVIALAGPSALSAFFLAAIIMLLEVMFITEMSIVNPAPGSFRVHASEIFGPAVGFVNGWMFWGSGVLGMASEVTAAAIYASFWLPHFPLWVFCLIFAAAMTLLNFLDVRGLSKAESWLASIKVVSLTVFILFGLLAVFYFHPTGLKVETGWLSSSAGFLPHGVRGMMASMLLVMFSFTGTGIIGLAVADTDRPERDLPPAIYIITAIVTALYTLSLLFLLLLVPWQNISASRSPFVYIMQHLSIPFAGALFNLVVLSASLSGINSSMYSASRMLFSLGKDRQAPPLMTATSRRGVPVYAVGVSSAVLLLTAVLSYLLPRQAFIILTGASGFLAMFNWLTISVTHYFYRKKTLREAPEKLRYRVPGYPYTTILGILLILAVLATSPLYKGQLAALVGGLIIIAVIILIYLVWQFKKRLRAGGFRAALTPLRKRR